MSMPPCRKNGEDCARRRAGCHGECKEYLDYRAERDAMLEKRYHDNCADEVVSEGRAKARASYYRRRKR